MGLNSGFFSLLMATRNYRNFSSWPPPPRPPNYTRDYFNYRSVRNMRRLVGRFCWATVISSWWRLNLKKNGGRWTVVYVIKIVTSSALVCYVSAVDHGDQDDDVIHIVVWLYRRKEGGAFHELIMITLFWQGAALLPFLNSQINIQLSSLRSAMKRPFWKFWIALNFFLLWYGGMFTWASNAWPRFFSKKSSHKVRYSI